ncbi:SLAP domain-containing protein [Psychrobacillus sp. NPDC096389]|uniref:SLAP domain-containing protein n=1 Tax=Psychrobacillus sp. NPDC096389 TaxID=3364490 RepID=UPI0037F89DC3
MQKLEFESSWDKTISNKDRQKIEANFLETSHANNQGILLTPLWQSSNHKGELLVTVLIHNFTTHPFSFQNTKLKYIEANVVRFEHSFTLPSLSIQAGSSTPWTFIFPNESLDNKLSFENGYLEII